MTTDSENQSDLFLQAIVHAKHRDARGYIVNLLASYVLDGITRTLQNKWPQMEGSVIEAVVAEAADVLYEAIAEGRVIAVPEGFLWKAAHNKLLKRHQAGLSVRVSFDESAEDHNRSDESSVDGPEREAMRNEAIRFARSVLPRLGQTTIVQVMSVIIDCVEKGELYIDNQFIADTLGLTKETVRKAKHRGFKRLEREAQRHGIEFVDEIAEPSSQGDEK